MEHFYETLPGGFWFKPSYDRLLDDLPTDRPSTVVEVGTCHGKSAAYFAVEAIHRGIPVTLHCVDNFTWSPVPVDDLKAACRRNLAPLGDRVVIHPTDSTTAALTFGRDSVDAVWIDADHGYRAVKADIAAWWPRLRPGGIMGGDDFYMDGVALAVKESGGYELMPGWRNESHYSGKWESWWRRKPS